MAGIAELLGDSLVDGSGQRVDPKALTREGTIVGLYFSAKWCPPCRQFTNQLVAFYDHVTSNRQNGDFRIVFLSSDEDEEDFNEYFAKMPWLAVDFKDREREAQISKHFQIGGIPTLILLDGESGDVITDRGRPFVLQDPKGSEFPWKQSSTTL